MPLLSLSLEAILGSKKVFSDVQLKFPLTVQVACSWLCHPYETCSRVLQGEV